MTEAFVYSWTDYDTDMLYVGYHKGSLDDGYICSSKAMLAEYNQRPHSFTRQIIATGTMDDMIALEKAILVSDNAASNPKYYNRSNGGGVVFTEEVRQQMSEKASMRVVSEETRRKMSSAHTGKSCPWAKVGKPLSESHKLAFCYSWQGKEFSQEHRKKLSEAAKAKGPVSQDTRKKLSEAMKGKPNCPQAVEYNGVKYKSMRQACLSLGISIYQFRKLQKEK